MITTDDRQLIRNGQPRKAASRPGIAALIHDGVSLVELQGKLLVHDLHQLKSGSGLPLLMLVMGIVLAFATLPVLLLGLGWMLASMTELTAWQATIAVAFVGGVGPALLLLLLGWKLIQKRVGVLSRTSAELRRNTDWLKRRMKSAF